MADGTSDDSRSSFSVDLSTGKAPTRRKRKGPAPVVQQTINLSTPKPPKAEAPEPSASTKSSSGAKRQKPKGTRRERPAPRSGNSLADLLDPETLARLRGDG